MAEAFNVWGEDAVATASATSSSTTTTSSSRSSTASRCTTSCSRRPTRATSSSSSTSAGSRSPARARTSTSALPEPLPAVPRQGHPLGPERAARGGAGTANAGRRFFFADVGKGVVDWPTIFSALKTRGHHYLIEHDDAGADETLDATSPRPRNPPARRTPPGPAASTSPTWTSPAPAGSRQRRLRPRQTRARAAHSGPVSPLWPVASSRERQTKRRKGDGPGAAAAAVWRAPARLADIAHSRHVRRRSGCSAGTRSAFSAIPGGDDGVFGTRSGSGCRCRSPRACSRATRRASGSPSSGRSARRPSSRAGCGRARGPCPCRARRLDPRMTPRGLSGPGGRPDAAWARRV